MLRASPAQQGKWTLMSEDVLDKVDHTDEEETGLCCRRIKVWGNACQRAVGKLMVPGVQEHLHSVNDKNYKRLKEN